MKTNKRKRPIERSHFGQMVDLNSMTGMIDPTLPVVIYG
jgi:hypothetical protein